MSAITVETEKLMRELLAERDPAVVARLALRLRHTHPPRRLARDLDVSWRRSDASLSSELGVPVWMVKNLRQQRK